MKTEVQQIEKVHPELLEYANKLKALGYTCFFPETDNRQITYMFFSKGSRIGYVQKAYFWGWTYSTVNKPSRFQGTGYRVGNQEAENELTVELAEQVLNAPLICPWVGTHGRGRYSNETRESVKAYSGPEEYTDKHSILTYWYL